MVQAPDPTPEARVSDHLVRRLSDLALAAVTSALAAAYSADGVMPSTNAPA